MTDSLLKLLFSGKALSAKSLTTYRGLTLVILLYVAYAVTELQSRVAVLESKIVSQNVVSQNVVRKTLTQISHEK